MKILQINSVCGYGSTGRIAVDMYRDFEKQGHNCLIAYGRGTAPEKINSYRIGSDVDNYLHVAKTRIFDKHGFGSKKATQQLVEKIKAYQPDMIHLHNLHGYYINIEVLFNYLATLDIPIKWTLHDCWAFTGHCSYFDYVGCSKWENGCNNCPQKKEYPTSLVFDNSKNNYAKKQELFTSVKNMTIITPSQWLTNLVQQSFLGKYPVEVVKNTIDLTVFKPTVSDFRKKHQLQNKFLVLGVASIWDQRKGLDTFIKLANDLNDDFKVIIVGVTTKQKEQLPKNILAIERTNSTVELAEIYTAVDAFVNPTLEDNYPTTNLEAIACGTKVVTYNTGGSPETLTEGMGVVVEKGNYQELFGVIKGEVQK